jgi:integrase
MGCGLVTVFRLKYVKRYSDRHGKLRHYFRRTGCPGTELPGEPGSTGFMAAYKAALDGAPALKAAREAPGSIGALAAAYYSGTEYQQLARVTQATYRNIIERIRADHGAKPLAMLQHEHVRRIVAAKAATPAAANALLKMLRILMQFAVAEGMRRDDPTKGVKRVRSQSEGFTTWTEADITAFESRWPLGTRERLALALLLYTGQRGRSDVARMGPQHVRGTSIAVQQHKTKTRLLIPIHPKLRAAIDACPSGHLTFITGANGKPYTSGSFGNWFADAVRAAGLSGLAAHGLRKAAARRLAEAGCTPHQIASVTGHRSLREIEHYTRAADQAGAAETAMQKIS